MFRARQLILALWAGGLAILSYVAAPCLAGSYANTYPASQAVSENIPTSSAASATPNVLQYFYFSPAQPVRPASAGWVSGGQYSLPPGAGAVTNEASAFGSITAGPSGAQYQTFVVRLTIANSGTESLTMAPSSMRFMDESGRLVTGATAYSGTMRVSMDTVGPGGRDELQLEFGLPTSLTLQSLGPANVEVPYAYGDTTYLTELRFIPSPPPPSAPVAAALPAYNTSNVYNNYNYYNEYIYPVYASSDYYPYYAYPSVGWDGWPWWWSRGFAFFGANGFFEEFFKHRHHEFGEHEHHEFGEHGHHEFGEHGFAKSGATVHSGATFLNGSGTGHRFNGQIGQGPNVTTGQPLVSHRGFVQGPTEHAFVPRAETPHAMTEQHFVPQTQTQQFTEPAFTPPSVTPRFSERSFAPQFSGRTFSPPSVTPQFSGRSLAPQMSAPRSFSNGFSGGGSHGFSGGGFRGSGGGEFHGGGHP